WRLHQTHPGRATLMLLSASAVTLAYQDYAVNLYQSGGWWLAVPMALALAGLALLAASRGWRRAALGRVAFVVVACALLAVPAVWSGLTVAYNSSQTLPQAYGNTGNGGFPGSFNNSRASSTQWTAGGLLQTLFTVSQSQTTPAASLGDMNQGVNQNLLA